MSNASSFFHQKLYLIVSLAADSGSKHDYPFPLSYLNLYQELLSTKQALIDQLRDLTALKSQQLHEKNTALNRRLAFLQSLAKIDQQTASTREYLAGVQRQAQMTRRIAEERQGQQGLIAVREKELAELREKHKAEHKRQIKELEKVHGEIEASKKAQMKLQMKVEDTENELALALKKVSEGKPKAEVLKTQKE